MGVMESDRTTARAELTESIVSTAPAAPRDDKAGLEGWLATPVIVILVLVCCAGPLLIGALAAAGAGAWLAGHGYTVGAAALLVVAAFLAWRIRVRLSRG